MRGDGTWRYPNHDELLKKCNLLPIKRYLERRRGTLRKYLEEYRGDLLKEVERCSPPARDPHKVLWWKQKYMARAEMRRLQAGQPN